MGPGCSSRGPFEDFSISEDVYATGLCAFVRFGFCFEKYGESMNMTLEKKNGVSCELATTRDSEEFRHLPSTYVGTMYLLILSKVCCVHGVLR